MYYMPRLSQDVNICGRSENECVARVRQQIEMQINNSFVCNCLPGCYAIAYESEMSSAPLLHDSKGKSTSTIAALDAYDVEDLAILHVFFRDGSFRAQRKEELIGFTEFLCKISKNDEYFRRF